MRAPPSGRRAGRGSARRRPGARAPRRRPTSVWRSAISTAPSYHPRGHGRPPQAAHDHRPARQRVRPPARCALTARPMDELVLTVLSQNTNDRNRDVAYFRLRERFPSWEAVREAPVEEIEDAIRPGGPGPDQGRADQADPRGDRRRRPALARGRPARRGARLPVRAARAWGARPPRACCCSRSGAPTSPVDTHVYRVGADSGCGRRRPRWTRPTTSWRGSSATTASTPTRSHVLLIRHGRRTCVGAGAALPRVPAAADVPEGRRRLAAHERQPRAARAAAALLLAVPFLIGIAVLKGLTVEIDTFHGSDAASTSCRRSCSSASGSTSPTTRPPRPRCSTW